MGAFSTSDLPGHEALHNRVKQALELCQESPGVDFKESATWGQLKHSLALAVLGMGNLRDGGIIIIGASERERTWKYLALYLATVNRLY